MNATDKYISDKYKEALASINNEIEEQIKLQGKVDKSTQSYRDSLAKQLKFEQEKLDILLDESESQKDLIQIRLKEINNSQ